MPKQILLYSESTNEKFDNFKDLFQSLSENGIIVNHLENGKIKTNKGTFEFTYIETENSVEDFKENVEVYRTTLRESVMLLKRQGIEVSKTELNKLAKQFEFLTEDTEVEEETDSEENNVSETEEDSEIKKETE